MSTSLRLTLSVLLISTASGLLSGQNDIRIIEDQGRGVITLSAQNLTNFDCEVTLNVESVGLEFSQPVPVKKRVPAGKTVLLVTLTPIPGQAWRYRYSTEYAQLLTASTPEPEVQEPAHQQQPKTQSPPVQSSTPPQQTPPVQQAPAEEESSGEIEPWDIPETLPAPPERKDPVVTETKPVPPEREEQIPTRPPVEKEQPSAPSSSQYEPDRMPANPPVTPPRREENPSSGKVNKDPGITLYTSPTCASCGQARAYLSGLGVKYQEVDLSVPSKDREGIYAQLLEQGYGGPVEAPVIAHGTQTYYGIDDVRSLLDKLVRK